jgi:hypothetical protein
MQEASSASSEPKSAQFWLKFASKTANSNSRAFKCNQATKQPSNPEEKRHINILGWQEWLSVVFLLPVSASPPRNHSQAWWFVQATWASISHSKFIWEVLGIVAIVRHDNPVREHLNFACAIIFYSRLQNRLPLHELRNFGRTLET